jgi:hypothetical protein
MKNSEFDARAEERARLRVEERLRMAPTDYDERAVAEEALRARDPLRRLQEMRGKGNEIAARLIETLI